MKAQRTTSLLFSGGQTVASVGNPGDTQKYDVKAFVIGTKTKVPGLEDVPNFAELDMDSALDEISMWRGYAVKKGTPASMIEWFQDICDKVSAGFIQRPLTVILFLISIVAILYPIIGPKLKERKNRRD